LQEDATANIERRRVGGRFAQQAECALHLGLGCLEKLRTFNFTNRGVAHDRDTESSQVLREPFEDPVNYAQRQKAFQAKRC
jgi:hypothetical protein